MTKTLPDFTLLRLMTACQRDMTMVAHHFGTCA